MNVRVVEGLRIFPAYLDARRASPPEGPPAPYASCDDCRAKMAATIRQHRGCPFEPPIERPSAVWQPRGWTERGVTATTCAAYTTELPIVREVVEAHWQWKQRTLTDYLDGEAPTRGLLDLLTVYEAGINEHEVDTLRRKSKGGG